LIGLSALIDAVHWLGGTSSGASFFGCGGNSENAGALRDGLPD